MRTGSLLKTCLVGAAALVASLPSPTLAHDHGDPRPDWRDREARGVYDFERVRADWLAECRYRVSEGAHLPPHHSGPDACENFLAEFYARRDHAPAYAGQYGAPAYAHPGSYGCCGQAPMVMVPVMLPPRAKPDCTETIEYVYEDVPAPRAAPRARARTPDKRVRIAPGKRVRTN